MTAAKADISPRSANLSPADFAEAACLSVSTVHNMIARGDVRGIKIGRSVRIPISEFKRLGLDIPGYLSEGAAR